MVVGLLVKEPGSEASAGPTGGADGEASTGTFSRLSPGLLDSLCSGSPAGLIAPMSEQGEEPDEDSGEDPDEDSDEDPDEDSDEDSLWEWLGLLGPSRGANDHV